MRALLQDLQYAHATGMCVEVTFLNGEKLVTGVHEVNEDEGYVSLYSPQTFDDVTTRRVSLGVIGSWAVTSVIWKAR